MKIVTFVYSSDFYNLLITYKNSRDNFSQIIVNFITYNLPTSRAQMLNFYASLY